MKYKILADINISGNIKGDVIDAEPHAMELYIERGQVEEYVEPVVKKKVVKKPAKKKKK